MRSSQRFSTLAFLLALCANAISPASKAQGHRMQAIAVDGPRTPLVATVPSRALAAQDLGPLAADRRLDAVTLRFNLSARQSAALDQLLADQANPASPRYRHWLTPEQYATQFGLASADLEAVKAWLVAQGLTVTEVARSHSFITVAGSVSQVEHAFATSMHSLSLDGETHFSNVSDPALPTALAKVVSGVTGLNDFRLKPHLRVRSIAAPKPDFTSSISGKHFIAPGDFYTIYDLSPLLSNSVNGNGITIAVVGQTDLSLADVAAFRTASGLSQNPPTVRLFGTDPGISTLDVDEAQLDVEWAGAVAPAANILYVNATDVLAGSMTQAIDNNLAPIITVSYGNCESGFGSSNIATFQGLFRQANAQGQTIVGPSGDSGATDCDYQTFPAKNGLAVDFPASSPNVTGVGGTQFNDAGGGFFGVSNNSNSGSALAYIPESIWNDSFSGTALSAAGGGASAYFTKPSFQTGPGVPNDFSRDVPDVSFHASPSNDPYLFCSKGSCTNGFRDSNGFLNAVGGTSASTPSFAGMLALLEQKIQARVGNANPVLYALANSSFSGSVFHDVVSGNNNSPCASGSPDCPASGVTGYSAGPGFDLTSGWGTIDGFNMVSDWLLAVPASGTATSGQQLSNTTLTASSNYVVSGTALPLTVSVSASSPGTTPTGSVQILVDNNPVGAAVALANGNASTTIQTAALSSGVHTITSAYSGDMTFAGSKSEVTVDVTSASAPDFSLSPTVLSSSVRAGGVAPTLTFNVGSLNGFSGPVSFTANAGLSGLAAQASFSPATVTLSASGSGATVLTLSAFVNAGQTSTGFVSAAPAHSAANVVPHLFGHAGFFELSGSALGMAGMLFFAMPRRRKRLPILLAALFSICMMSVAGCSNAGTAVVPVTPPVSSTPTVTNAAPGTYSLRIAATGTVGGQAVTHIATVTFVVQ